MVHSADKEKPILCHIAHHRCPIAVNMALLRGLVWILVIFFILSVSSGDLCSSEA